jgi:hypothetical protein
MPPSRGRSGTRKGSGLAVSGKKGTPNSQHGPAQSPLNSDRPGLGQTYQCGAYLRDLNDEEKKKVANLIQQVCGAVEKKLALFLSSPSPLLKLCR